LIIPIQPVTNRFRRKWRSHLHRSDPRPELLALGACWPRDSSPYESPKCRNIRPGRQSILSLATPSSAFTFHHYTRSTTIAYRQTVSTCFPPSPLHLGDDSRVAILDNNHAHRGSPMKRLPTRCRGEGGKQVLTVCLYACRGARDYYQESLLESHPLVGWKTTQLSIVGLVFLNQRLR
jgi:hypothetical protein